MSQGVSRRRNRLDPRKKFFAIFEKNQPIPDRQEISSRNPNLYAEIGIQPAFVSPIPKVPFAYVDLGIRKQWCAIIAANATDMIDMGMRADDRINFSGVDTGFREAALQPPSPSPEHLHIAHAGLEHDFLAADLDDWDILIENDIVGWQKMPLKHLAHFVAADTDKIATGVAECQGPVGNNGDFGLTYHKAMKPSIHWPSLGPHSMIRIRHLILSRFHAFPLHQICIRIGGERA
jgi:hypothetical protein